MKFKNLFIYLLIFWGGFSFVYGQDFTTGLVKDVEGYEAIPLTASLMRGDYSNLPTRYSLKKFAPTPKNQGAYGNCVGWSAAYAARTILYSYEENLINTSSIDLNAFSPFFLYEQVKPYYDEDCKAGTTFFRVLEELKDMGVVKYRDYSQVCEGLLTSSLEDKAEEYRITDYKRLFGSNSTAKTLYVKKAISENKPVLIGIECCNPSFINSAGKDYWEPTTTETVPKGNGHALTLVAYDDEKYGGAFQIMNSWGTEWGSDGFIWISYEDFEDYCFEAFEMSVMATQKTVELQASFRFKLSAGSEMEAEYNGGGVYEMKKPYYSGTLFQLMISNEEPAYVYAFGSDLTQSSYPVFPFEKGISAYLGYRGNNIAIPDEDHYIKLDDNTGSDYFCLLVSKEALDFDRILEEMESVSGEFEVRLKKVLGDDLASPQNVDYDNAKVSFTAEVAPEKIVPLIVLIPHVN